METQSIFWKPKPCPEELFDVQADPDEVHNLANAPEAATIKARLRTAQQDLARKIRDVGFLPEGERLARAQGQPLYDFGHDDSNYPFDRVFAAAELASAPQVEAIPEMKKELADSDSGVRYWGVLGLRMHGAAAVSTAVPELRAALKDASPDVRIAAAEALAQFGGTAEEPAALAELVKDAAWGPNDFFTSLAALTALDALDPAAVRPVMAQAMPTLATNGPMLDPRYSSYVPSLLEHLADKLGLPKPAMKKTGKGEGAK